MHRVLSLINVHQLLYSTCVIYGLILTGFIIEGLINFNIIIVVSLALLCIYYYFTRNKDFNMSIMPVAVIALISVQLIFMQVYDIVEKSLGMDILLILLVQVIIPDIILIIIAKGSEASDILFLVLTGVFVCGTIIGLLFILDKVDYNFIVTTICFVSVLVAVISWTYYTLNNYVMSVSSYISLRCLNIIFALFITLLIGDMML